MAKIYVYKDKTGVYHAVDNEATAKRFASSATNEQIFETEGECINGYPLIDGWGIVKEDEYETQKAGIYAYDPKSNGATKQPLANVSSIVQKKVAAFFAQVPF